MTQYISIQEAMHKGSGKVSVRGWVHRERGSNKYKFVVLRDSSSLIQCIFEREKFDKKWDEIDHLQVEASLEINGQIKKDDRAPTGYEIQVESYTLVGASESFPITKDQSVEFLADHRHLWLRSQKMIAILKIRSTVFNAIHEYFRGQGFYEYHSPIFQAVQAEGGAELFSVNYFDKKDVFLAQTWQLYAEPAIFALEKIYTISPSFRAEKSKTSRHLTEYWHAEMEVAWADLNDIINHGEQLLKFIFTRVLEKNREELEVLGRDIKKLEPIVKKPFIQMTYDDALKLLKEKCDMKVTGGKELRTTEEDKLTA